MFFPNSFPSKMLMQSTSHSLISIWWQSKMCLLSKATKQPSLNAWVKTTIWSKTWLSIYCTLSLKKLALKICLIVEKHSVSRRWHFDTILKVLILADQSVKEESAKSLVHLITSTPQLQNYCMAKLFFSTCENLQNDALAKVCIYLLGELGEVILKNREL